MENIDKFTYQVYNSIDNKTYQKMKFKELIVYECKLTRSK